MYHFAYSHSFQEPIDNVKDLDDNYISYYEMSK